jgi:hypothetical protein
MREALKALLITPDSKGTIFRKEVEMPVSPYPGLGIRIDVYDMLRVDSVVVGDFGYDVTCICTVEDGGAYTAEQLRLYGFEEGPYP